MIEKARLTRSFFEDGSTRANLIELDSNPKSFSNSNSFVEKVIVGGQDLHLFPSSVTYTEESYIFLKLRSSASIEPIFSSFFARLYDQPLFTLVMLIKKAGLI